MGLYSLSDGVAAWAESLLPVHEWVNWEGLRSSHDRMIGLRLQTGGRVAPSEWTNWEARMFRGKLSACFSICLAGGEANRKTT
jgi:hypothetical protein